MSPRYFSSALALLALATVAHAARPKADAQPQAAPAAAAPAEVQPPPPPYELKNKSAFTISTTNPRPPFWPIGWVHRDASSPIVQDVVPVQGIIDEHFFKLTSILIGNGGTASLAVINGRAYGEGEYVHMPRAPGGPPNRVRVQRINDGSVTLEHANHTMQIPLRREELSTRHGDEKLLSDQDRDDADPAPAPVPVGKPVPAAQPTPATAPRTARH